MRKSSTKYLRASNELQVRAVAGSVGQADRDAGAKVRRRESAQRRADDPAGVPALHPPEEVRGDHGDGQGGETAEPQAAGGAGPAGHAGAAARLPQPGLRAASPAAAATAAVAPAAAAADAPVAHQPAHAHTQHVAEGEAAPGRRRRRLGPRLQLAHAQEPERPMRDSNHRPSGMTMRFSSPTSPMYHLLTCTSSVYSFIMFKIDDSCFLFSIRLR